MDVSKETKIVLLGKTGTGKSSLGNTILGDSLFKAKMSSKSVTSESQAESKVINGTRITVVDTPGFFDTNMPEEELKRELISCLVDCAPGVDAFLIVLQVGRITDHEKAVIDKIVKLFSFEALKHSVVVFTHGNDLPKESTIKEFVAENVCLEDLVNKCGGRCHVVDNEHWHSENQRDAYRSNRGQVAQLLNTIETMKTREGPYTNKLLEIVEKEKAKSGKDVVKRLLIYFAGATVGMLLGALFGTLIMKSKPYSGAGIGAAAGIVIGIGIAYNAETPQAAAIETAKTVCDIGMTGLTIAKNANDVSKKQGQKKGQTEQKIVVHDKPVT